MRRNFGGTENCIRVLVISSRVDGNGWKRGENVETGEAVNVMGEENRSAVGV